MITAQDHGLPTTVSSSPPPPTPCLPLSPSLLLPFPSSLSPPYSFSLVPTEPLTPGRPLCPASVHPPLLLSPQLRATVDIIDHQITVVRNYIPRTPFTRCTYYFIYKIIRQVVVVIICVVVSNSPVEVDHMKHCFSLVS